MKKIVFILFVIFLVSCEKQETFDDGRRSIPISEKLDLRWVLISYINDQGDDLLKPGPNCLDLSKLRIFHKLDGTSIQTSNKISSEYNEAFHNDYVIAFQISDSTLVYDPEGNIDTLCRLNNEGKISYNSQIVYEGKLSINDLPVLVIEYEYSHLKK
jgi:hypothetical protein